MQKWVSKYNLASVNISERPSSVEFYVCVYDVLPTTQTFSQWVGEDELFAD